MIERERKEIRMRDIVYMAVKIRSPSGMRKIDRQTDRIGSQTWGDKKIQRGDKERDRKEI